MYVIIANGIEKYRCRSFHEAEKASKKHKGKIVKVRYRQTKMPKAALLSYGDSPSVKREMYRQAYDTENKYGYHIRKSWSCNG